MQTRRQPRTMLYREMGRQREKQRDREREAERQTERKAVILRERERGCRQHNNQ